MSLHSTVAGTTNHNNNRAPLPKRWPETKVGMKKRTARITVETERLLVIHRSKTSFDGWCGQCQAEVSLLGLEGAAALAGASQRAIFRWAEAGEIHFIETEDGKVMFCLNSISRHRTLKPRKLLRS
jgi:hypothetical protein